MRRSLSLLPLLFATVLALPAPAAASDEENYGFLRLVEGTVTVLSVDGSAEDAEANLPLLTGDQLALADGARLEAILADRTRLRLEGDSELRLTAIAFSADGDARQTRLDLRRGTLLLVVTDEALGDELPRIDVANATLYLLAPGEYRVESDGGGWSQLVVRQGAAEVVTERGSVQVAAGSAATIEGERWAAARIGPAPAESGLEQWARAAGSGSAQTVRYVDSSLAYAASDLDEYGTWVSVDSSWAWRPRVASDWRPYWNGRWVYTPSGLTWVSYDPWGWVPHHYGTWSLSPAYGWVWYPGYTYSPAWVYWYWGDRWAGWCPVGYYTRYYRGPLWSAGFRWGPYGWAGGGFGLWSHWSFSPSHRIHDRRDRRHPHWRAHEVERELGRPTLPRGLVTTDTRGLDPARLREGRSARDLLSERNPGFRRVANELPDVTDFVARRRDLSPEVRERMQPRPDDRQRLRGTPLDVDATARRTDRPQPGWQSPARDARLAERPEAIRRGRLAPLPSERPDRRPDQPSELRERPVRIDPSGRRNDAGTPPVEGRPGISSGARPERPAAGPPTDRPVLRERPAPGASTPAPNSDRPVRTAPPEQRNRDTDGERRSIQVRPQPDGDRQNWRFREAVPHAPQGERPYRSPNSPATRDSGQRSVGTVSPAPVSRETWQPAPRPAPRDGWRPAGQTAPRPPQPGRISSESRPQPVTPGAVGDRPPVRRIVDGVRQPPPSRPANLAPRSGSSPAPRVEQRPARPSSPSSPPPSSSSSGSGGGSRTGGSQQKAPSARPRGGQS
ncbi:MAG: hypothetical protein QM311_03075 [Acidobacteriota bacterium]|nr:hypothetical protein [Acidobacteriota bacterium]